MAVSPKLHVPYMFLCLMFFAAWAPAGNFVPSKGVVVGHKHVLFRSPGENNAPSLKTTCQGNIQRTETQSISKTHNSTIPKCLTPAPSERLQDLGEIRIVYMWQNLEFLKCTWMFAKWTHASLEQRLTTKTDKVNMRV